MAMVSEWFSLKWRSLFLSRCASLVVPVLLSQSSREKKYSGLQSGKLSGIEIRQRATAMDEAQKDEAQAEHDQPAEVPQPLQKKKKKGPVNGWIVFSNERRRQAEELGEDTSLQDLGDEWRSLTIDERDYYKQKAQEQNEREGR